MSPKWKKIDYYVNFIYAGKKEGVVGFEYTFRFENGTVVYAYSKNAGGILVSESLRVDDNLVFEEWFFLHKQATVSYGRNHRE